MTISGIKIYGSDGELKKEISPEQAQIFYDQNNKSDWSLSPNERKIWDKYLNGRTLMDESYDPKPEPKPRAKPKRVIRNYTLTCKHCKKTVTIHNKKAVYCNRGCAYEAQKARQSKEKRSVKWRAKM